VYDRPIQANGFTKEEMLSWWKERQGIQDESDARRSLSQRLMALTCVATALVDVARHDSS